MSARSVLTSCPRTARSDAGGASLDPLTHACAGLTVAAAAGLAGCEAALLAAASVAPDIDLVVLLGGRRQLFTHHRASTHSLLAFPLFAALVAAFGVLLGDLSQVRAMALAGLGLGLHLAADIATPYGVRAFWPLTPRWISLDLVYSLTPGLSVAVAIGALGFLLDPGGPIARSVGVGILAAVTAHLGLAAALKRRAARLLEQKVPEMASGLILQAHMLTPFLWKAAGLMPDGEGRIYAVEPRSGHVTLVERYPAPAAEDARLSEASDEPGARMIHSGGRLPWTCALPEPDGRRRVCVQDLYAKPLLFAGSLAARLLALVRIDRHSLGAHTFQSYDVLVDGDGRVLGGGWGHGQHNHDQVMAASTRPARQRRRVAGGRGRGLGST